MSEDIILTIILIIMLSLVGFSIYFKQKEINRYKYKIEYNCDWNGCFNEYTNKYQIKDNCLITDKKIICEEYTITKR